MDGLDGWPAAGGEHRRRIKGKQRLLFVEEKRMVDVPCLTYRVFKINLKDMFVSAAGEANEQEEEDWAVGMRSFPRPVARFDTIPGRPERLDLAVVSGTGGAANIIVAVSSDKRTVVYDTAAAVEVPCGRELRYSMTNGATLVPLGRRVYAVATNLWPPPPTPSTSRYSRRDREPSFQALQLQRPAAAAAAHRRRSSGCWSWRSLPAPPRELYSRAGSAREIAWCRVTSFMAAGARVWVSAPDRGTFSFDTARLAWRKEGDWELPFQHRGLFVPDLGLCFGICPRRLCLCAFDAPTAGAGAGAGRPPAVRYVWQDESYPRECGDRGFHLRGPGSLAYLGDGKFCITWTIGIEYAEQDGITVASRFGLFLMAVQVVRSSAAAAGGGGARIEELRLVKHKVRCYKMSTSAEGGYVLQPSLG